MSVTIHHHRSTYPSADHTMKQQLTTDSHTPKSLAKLRKAIWLAATLAGGTLAVGAALRGLWGLALASALLAVAALVADLSPHIRFFINVFFLGSAVVLILELLQGTPAGLGIVAVAGMLTAWDLCHFRWRLQAVNRIEKGPLLISQHLLRLLLIDAAGVTLALVALALQLDFDLSITLLLIAILMTGISQIIGFLRRESD